MDNKHIITWVVDMTFQENEYAMIVFTDASGVHLEEGIVMSVHRDGIIMNCDNVIGASTTKNIPFAHIDDRLE